ncbi:hypothetical protein N7526_011437 [Penicillium atrosanguineum]|nr:hypothetical protein N7526_011437 [Penicillium atrosanguineum]
MASASHHRSAFLALLGYATESSINLLQAIQSHTIISKSWRDLAKELKLTKNIFASLDKLVTASTHSLFLGLASPLKGCGTACNEFEEKIVDARARSNENSTRNAGKLQIVERHAETFRRLLNGYNSTFQIVSLASIIYDRQPSLTSAKDLISFKTLIHNTLEDIHSLDNEEKADVLGLITISGEWSDKVSVLGDCREICVMFCELVDQTEHTPQHNAVNSSVISEHISPDLADLLSEIHTRPSSRHLSAYFEALTDGSRKWDVDTFIRGAQYLAKIIGPEKGRYFEDPLQGLHYPSSFAELWNQTYPQQRIDMLHFAVCPPGWSSGIENCRLDLTYTGDGPLSMGLNVLFQGPTTLDCGMFCQLLVWMAIRYLIGDNMFDLLFQFKKGEFTISQQCHKPVDPATQIGNLLFPFYDRPLHDKTEYHLEARTRIQMRAFFNHPRYLAKHPKGTGRLQNVIQIDDCFITFRPGAPQNLLSSEQLEGALIAAYNAPRTLADEAEIRFFATNPDNIHPYLKKSFGSLAREAKDFADHTLSEAEWRKTKFDRERMAHGCHLIFNFQRLITSLEKTRDAYLNGIADKDVIYRAKDLRKCAFLKP